ncbi:MAG: hypothetical protein QOD47_1490 [Gemmatimonadaceae bacterium]|jgi:hypothetical protein|nr:hypothetical protein [Gemmatimonadaceae bacterium]
MRLSSQKVFLLLLVSGIACSDSTGPVSAFFTLQTINGRALPTFIAETPGPTTIVISSNLILDKAGNAVVIEHRNEMLRGDVTDTTTYQYRRNGTEVEIALPVACLAIGSCPPFVWRGTISPLGLSLILDPYSSDSHIVYTYRRVPTDPV